MKKLLPFCLALLMLNLGCNKDDDTIIKEIETEQTIEEELLDVYTLQYELTNHFLDTKDDYADVVEHQDAVFAWIKQRPDVLEVDMYDFTYYTIKHITGITTVVSFVEEAEDHASATRGGGFTDGTLRQYVSKTNMNDENLITNKNVLVLCPYPDFMYDGDRSVKGRIKKISEIKDQFDEANLDFKVTYKINNNADVEAFSNLEDYGFIIMATHGSKTGVHVAGTFVPKDGEKMTEPSKAKLAPIDEKNKELIKSRYLNPTLRTVYSTESASRDTTTGYELTFPYFATLKLKMDNSILYGGFCYSGFKGGLLGQALEPQGLKAYYGWGYQQNAESGSSLSISNNASWDAEKILIDNLTKDGDTTGVAHLIDNVKLVTDDNWWRNYPNSFKRRLKEDFNINGPQPFSQWLSKNYRYEVCENEEENMIKASIDIEGYSTRQFESSNTSYYTNVDGEGSVLISARAEADGTYLTTQVVLRTFNFKGVGTYPISKASPSNEGWDAYLVFNDNRYWDSVDSPTGTITISEECATYLKGTFSFTARYRSDTNQAVTNGEFVINF